MARTVTVNGKEYQVPANSNIAAKMWVEIIKKAQENPALTSEDIKNIRYDVKLREGIGEHISGAFVNSVTMENYLKFLDDNPEFGISSSDYKDETGNLIQKTVNKETTVVPNPEKVDTSSGDKINKTTSSASDYESMVEAAYEDRLNLMTDINGSAAQRFRDTMYGAIAEEQAIAEQSLGQAELDAYRMLGQQQLELENTIAEQRKKALVSGTTSAQLAAGQLQNMFAAQSGAAQVAQGLANQRTQMNQTYAEKRTGVETSLYDYINQQQTIAATAGAQNLAALSSYASYANKNYNDMMSLYKAKQDIGTSAWNQILDVYNKQQ